VLQVVGHNDLRASAYRRSQHVSIVGAIKFRRIELGPAFLLVAKYLVENSIAPVGANGPFDGYSDQHVADDGRVQHADVIDNCERYLEPVMK